MCSATSKAFSTLLPPLPEKSFQLNNHGTSRR